MGTFELDAISLNIANNIMFERRVPNYFNENEA